MGTGKSKISNGISKLTLPIALVALLVLIFGVSAVSLFEHEMRGHASFQAGKVEITLSAPADPANEEATSVKDISLDGEMLRRYTVLPTDESVPCYIRVKADIAAKDTDLLRSMTDMNSTDGSWVSKPDGYVYFTGILAPENYDQSAADFSDKPARTQIVSSASYDNIFSIATCEPVDKWRDIFNNSNLSASFVETITADAIQAEHFSPDFDVDDPWLGQEPEVSVSIGD